MLDVLPIAEERGRTLLRLGTLAAPRPPSGIAGKARGLLARVVWLCGVQMHPRVPLHPSCHVWGVTVALTSLLALLARQRERVPSMVATGTSS